MASKKIEALTPAEKHEVATIFEPLLSKTFGGEKYKKYYLQDMQEIIRSEVSAYIQKNSPGLNLRSVLHDTITRIRKAKNITKVLTILSDMALIEDSISEDL